MVQSFSGEHQDQVKHDEASRALRGWLLRADWRTLHVLGRFPLSLPDIK